MRAGTSMFFGGCVSSLAMFNSDVGSCVRSPPRMICKHGSERDVLDYCKATGEGGRLA